MARLPWIRLFTEARNDRKLELLDDAQHRVWFKLLCYSSESEPRGVFRIDEVLAIEVANADDDLMASTIERMKKLRLIEIDGEWGYFPAFADRQYAAGGNVSDMPDEILKRVQKHRAKDTL